MSDLRVSEILRENGLDFTIEKLPMVAPRNFTSVDEGGNIIEEVEMVKTPYFGLYNSKTGEIINTVKKGYTVSQNEDIVRLVLEGMSSFGELSVSKAGSLDGGRRVFMQLGVDGLSSVGRDKIKRYITVLDSNDGSASLSVGIGDLTMSCQNQFYYFKKNAKTRMQHSASLTEKMQMIPQLIEESLEMSMRMTDKYRVMYEREVTNDDAHKLVEHLVGISRLSSTGVLSEASSRNYNAMEKLYEMIRIEMAQKGENAWGLHSGVTRWTTHEKSAPRRANGRIESSMTGTNYKTNQMSLDFVSSLVGL